MKYRQIKNEEYKFEDGTIVSSTDINGIITYANKTFCEISGYDRDELIGSRHNIIRHPDVPNIIFYELWETISHGKTWEGILKNLRKDGRYYWIYTVITPVIENGITIGYTSVRRPVFDVEKRETAEKFHKLILERSDPINIVSY
ncbi:MAG: PAS domain S-box protein [Sulfurovaceae bacterium]|nr:PAS domain S-box protein [Sulfurovaceae bacterium]MDD5549367.1 PAS domain S-box protein [Sulfurovaceae bacterium]